MFEAIPRLTLAKGNMSFKGIRFGMNADQIAELGGGDTKSGCYRAIVDKEHGNLLDKKPWSYGGIDAWSAECMEDKIEHTHVPRIVGMYKLSATVASHNNEYATKTHSVDELVQIYSKVFGTFDIETVTVKNGLGQKIREKRSQ